jgi:hypothetical protein
MELPIEMLVAFARQRGLILAPDRAERLRPLIESLLDRLGQIADTLPEEASPPPGGLPRSPR